MEEQLKKEEQAAKLLFYHSILSSSSVQLSKVQSALTSSSNEDTGTAPMSGDMGLHLIATEVTDRLHLQASLQALMEKNYLIRMNIVATELEASSDIWAVKLNHNLHPPVLQEVLEERDVRGCKDLYLYSTHLLHQAIKEIQSISKPLSSVVLDPNMLEYLLDKRLDGNKRLTQFLGGHYMSLDGEDMVRVQFCSNWDMNRYILVNWLNFQTVMDRFIQENFTVLETESLSPTLLSKLKLELDELSHKHKLLSRITCNNRIIVVGTRNAVTEVKVAVQEGLCCLKQNFVEIVCSTVDIVDFVRTHKRDKIQDLEKRHIVSIEPAKSHDGFIITGGRAEVQMCKLGLQNLVTFAQHSTREITDYLRILLLSKDNKFLEAVGSKMHCLVRLREPSSGKTDQEMLPYSSPFVSSTNLTCGSTCDVRQGDMANFAYDAIVLYANGNLQSVGTTSLIASSQSGPDMAKDCEKHVFINEPLVEGQVYTSQPGFLPSKLVIHAVIPRWRGGDNQEEQTLFNCIDNCFDEAEKFDIQSIAIPLIEENAAGFPLNKSANIIVKAITERDKHGEYLPRFITLVGNDTEAANIFITELCGRNALMPKIPRRMNLGSRSLCWPSWHYDRQKTIKDFVVQGNTIKVKDKLKISIIAGNLAKVKADCLVNPVDANLDLEGEGLSAMLSKEAGPALQTACSLLAPMAHGQVKQTDGFNLATPKVLHCCILQYPDLHNITNLREVVMNCLTKAVACSHKSIVLPPLGNLKQDCAGIMLRAIMEYAADRTDDCLEDVKIVFDILNDTAMQIFDDELKRLVVEDGYDIHIHRKRAHPMDIPKRHSSIEEGANIVYGDSPRRVVALDYYGDSYTDIAPCERELEAMLEGAIYTLNWRDRQSYIQEQPYLERLTTHQIEQLRKDAEMLHVQILFMPIIVDIQIRGLESDVLNMTGRVLDLLTEHRTISLDPVWEYQDVELVWRRCQPSISKEIENSVYKSTDTSAVNWSDGDNIYYRFSDLGEAPVRRIDPNKAEITRFQAEVELPHYWESPLDVYKEVLLEAHSAEYRQVMFELGHTLPPRTFGLKVKQITRIQNPHLYREYAHVKLAVAARLGKARNRVETRLWHGTDEHSAANITQLGFNRSYCGRNGASQGRGFYFATDASYSIDHRFARPNSVGERCLVYTQVVTGQWCKGNPVFKMPPYCTLVDQFDSVVDDIRQPSMYVIFNQSWAYPEYIIKLEPFYSV